MIDEYEPEDNTGLLSNLNRVERRRRMFYDVTLRGQTMLEETDRKLNTNISMSDSLRRAMRKTRRSIRGYR